MEKVDISMTSICKHKLKKTIVLGLLLITAWILTFFCATPTKVYASELPNTEANDGNINETVDSDLNSVNNDDITFYFNSGEGTGSMSATLQIMLVLTVITLAPSILIMMTSFIRLIVVLHFVRSALGTQTTPPNQVMIGLALFLTLFIMSPIFTKVNAEAIQPLTNGEISREVAFERGMEPIRNFMFDQMPENQKELQLFLDIAGISEVNGRPDVPTTVLIPAFILSELKAAFIIGFLIYIPFIVIDMVVASTLMSMGMMMLPPTTISMPFKILLFIMADGWNLIIGEVVKTFY